MKEKKQNVLSELAKIRQDFEKIITGSYDLTEQERSELLILDDELREVMLDIELEERNEKECTEK